ncbi:MAG: hypothetical protein ACKVY0_29990 [Prosthecobacter sp.]|uniref:hypothetical protein n=1 Tax=Prosthecobacter sp. TaxID=1965333 RepID=UPI003902B85C
MASLFSSICGTCGRNYQSLMLRAAKAGGPLAGVVGMASDFGTPVGDFVPWLVLGSAVLTLLAGVMWFGGRQRQLRRALADGKLTQEEIEQATEHNPWSVGFAFGIVSTVVLGLFLGAQQLVAKEGKGVLATLVPALEQMQQSLFKIEQDVAEVKTTTGRIETKTDQVLTKLEDLSAAFEHAGKNGVIIANPATPAEHYHNARLYELKSDFASARKSYNAYLASGVEFIDPYLAYTDMLKVQDGLEGAREVVAAMRKNNTSTSLEIAAALLLPKEQRIAALKQGVEKHADFAPAVHLLSREFSAEKLGEQTLADKREEKALLEQFRALDGAGKFQRFVMDKKQAKAWLDDAESRLAKLTAMPAAVLENPVTLSANQSNQGWMLTLGFTDYKIKNVEYKLDGAGEFKSTGFANMTNPQTGLPMPSQTIMVATLAPGEHTLEVRYTDMTDKLNGPFVLKLNTAEAALKAGKSMLDMTATSWLSIQQGNVYFTGVLTHRGILKSIRYSFDSEKLDQEFPFSPPKPGEGPYQVGDGLPYLKAPDGLKFVALQLTFIDGTQSEVKTYPAP